MQIGLHKPDAHWSPWRQSPRHLLFSKFQYKAVVKPFLDTQFFICLFETNRESALFPRVFQLLLKWVRLQNKPWWMADRHLLCHHSVLGSHFVPFVPRAPAIASLLFALLLELWTSSLATPCWAPELCTAQRSTVTSCWAWKHTSHRYI